MKQLITATHIAELDLLKNVLEGAGVKCALKNELVSQVIPAAPFSVELWVENDGDLQKAQALCEAWCRPTADAPGTWGCSNCGQRLKGQFDSCWQCGTKRKPTDMLTNNGADDEDVS